MKIKHEMTLSTTEPNNNVGVIKVRQEDINSQIFDIEVEANGEPVDFTGLTPFFINKTKLDEGKPIEQADRMTVYPTEGCLEYTLDKRDWQWIGKNTAYISFRRLNNDKSWSEMYSTRDFTYQVTEGVTEGTVFDSGYVWTFEDLLRMFQKFISDSENSMLSFQEQWQKFVEENKAILESLDPSGELLNQLHEVKEKQAELDGTLQTNAALQIGGETPRPVFTAPLNTLRNKLDKTKFNVLHMTDIHTDYGYERTSWKYAQYFWSHLTNMQSLQDLADVAIYNGDNADCYIKDKDISEQQQRKFGIKAIRSAAIPTFVNLGNHDNGSPP
ncbi:BppU family phage baseplate upper protein, partial [Enterococcus wangshanyuanii]